MKTKSKLQPQEAESLSYGWEDDAIEVPRGFEPQLGRIGRGRKFLRRFVAVSVFFQGLSFVLLFALLYSILVQPWNDVEAGTAVGPAASSSPGRTTATLAVQEWLAAEPAPLLEGQILSWDGAQVIPPAVTIDENGDEIVYPATSEVSTFTLRDKSGSLYTASVNVAVDPRGGAKVLAGPSLIPVAPAIQDEWANQSGPWPGLTDGAESTPAIQTAVDAWTKAYISGDPEALRVAVGDPDPESVYVPLQGVASAKNKVTFLATKNAEEPGVVVGRVETSITWAGAPKPEGNQVAAEPPPVVWDVLIERADTGAPVVTAWGAPGTGATLTRYQNANKGGQRPIEVVDPTATPTAVPTPAPANAVPTPAAPAPTTAPVAAQAA